MVSTGFETFVWKSLLAIAISGLIGLEREKKEHHIVGFRTFALTGFLGMLLTSITENPFAVALGLLGVFAMAALYYWQRARHTGSWGVTTALMLPTTYVLGALVGAGFFVEASLAAIIAVFLLLERHEVHEITQKVSKSEIIDLLLFAIIAFVVYPQLPSTPALLFGQSLNLQYFWTIVVAITAISFAGFILTKYVGRSILPIASFFGGLVSSVAVVAVMARKAKNKAETTAAVLAAAGAGSVTGDAVLLYIIAPSLVPSIFAGIFSFFVGYAFVAAFYARKSANESLQQTRRPLSLKFIAEFSLAFVIVNLVVGWTAANMPQQLILTSFLGGILSSTSVLASMAFLYNNGTASAASVLVCFAAALSASLLTKAAVASVGSGRWIENAKAAAIILAVGIAGTLVNFFFKLA